LDERPRQKVRSPFVVKDFDDALGAHRKLDPAQGLQDAQLHSGARVHIVHRDIARGRHLVANIRLGPQ
jgi:pilus assembly protein CpaF